MLDGFTGLVTIQLDHVYELSVLAQVLPTDIMYPSRNGGTEQDSLELLFFYCFGVLLFIYLLNHFFDIFTEPHVQHPICFV